MVYRYDIEKFKIRNGSGLHPPGIETLAEHRKKKKEPRKMGFEVLRDRRNKKLHAAVD